MTGRTTNGSPRRGRPVLTPGSGGAAPLVVALVALVWCATFTVGPARAYWAASSVAPGSGAAAVGSLNQPLAPVVVTLGTTATLTWVASTRADGLPVTGYTVQRYGTDSIAQTVGGTCAGTVTGTTCTETGVADAAWRYAVTPVLGPWTGPRSPLSTSALVDGTAPVLAVPVATATSGAAYQNGSTVWVRGAAAGSLTLASTVTDTGSGPAGATTGALAGTVAAWTHTAGRVSSPAGGPYVSNPFAWGAGTTGSVTTTVTADDVAGNVSSPRTITFVDDSVAPVGATLVTTTGATSTTSLTLTLGTVTDAGSGLATRTLLERTAPLSVSTCGTFGAWTAVAAVSTTSVVRTLADATCYDYQYVVVDNLGNTATATLAAPVRNRSYAAVVGATTGILDYYRLGETSSGAIGDSSVATSTNNGTCTGGPTRGQTGAITGDSDTAFTFDGVDDTCTVTRGIASSFSIELWFKAGGPGVGTGSTWSDGAGLVSSDLLGLPTDFGLTFMQDGRFCAGTGLTVSTCTTTTYLSGWHHVVLTRDASTGSLVIYVDGVVRSSVTGTLSLLNGGTNLRFGSLRSSSNYVKGTLDEVALYTVPLPAATVLQHYQTGTG